MQNRGAFMTKIINVKDKLGNPAEEAYRVLRTNIQFCNFDSKIKTLAITSCNPGEGKTTTAINLSISMAMSGMKILLIDADLRKPALVKRLGGTNAVGLTNLISGQASLQDAINYTDVDGFCYITCGPTPPNPAELLSSERFDEIINEAKKHFDMIIIDTPPLGSVIDCAIISSRTDGTLIVIKSKAVDYRSAMRVKEQLEKVNARIIGVVLNKLDRKEYRYYYSPYEYYGNGSAENTGKGWFRKHRKQKAQKQEA
jgi:capsular exopolysaccharide synthesis family protein